MRKMALIGGGEVANSFYVVNLISLDEHDGVKIATLETGNCRLPNPFKPHLGSWQIAELEQELEDLPLGHYLHLGDRIADYESGGMFATVYQLKIVKKLKNGEVV